MDGFKLPGLVAIDRPRPSLGSNRDEQWANIKLHFDSGIGSRLMQEVIVTWLRNTLNSFKAIVGLQSTLADHSAKLLDINSPMAAYHLSNLSNSTIIISPRLALTQTVEDSTTWATRMTQLWTSIPTQAASKLRLRDSNPARSKKFSEVQATKEQIEAAKRRNGHAAVTPSEEKPETLRATIDIPVPVESQLEVWLGGLMDTISHNSGVSLTQHLASEGLAMGSWQAVRDFE